MNEGTKNRETVEGTPRPEEEKEEVLHVEQMSTLKPMKDAVLQHVDMPEGRCSPRKPTFEQGKRVGKRSSREELLCTYSQFLTASAMLDSRMKECI